MAGFAAMFAAISIFSGCSRTIIEPSAAFTSIVSAYSGGTLEEGSTVRIVFAAERRGEIRTDGVFRFSPPLKGQAVQTAPDEIAFIPEKGSMKPGKIYTCKVNLARAIGVKDPMLKKFVFGFLAAPRRASLIGGDVLIKNDTLPAAITGKVLLSCSATEEEVGRMIRVNEKHDSIKVEKMEGNTFNYKIAGISRAEKDKRVDVSLKGDGFICGEKVQVTVPGTSGVFRILSVRDNRGKDACVAITFSQTLGEIPAGGFDLQGAGQFYVEAEGNTVRLYHRDTASGDITLTVNDFVRSSSGEKLPSIWTSTLKRDISIPSVELNPDGNIVPDVSRARIDFIATGLRSVDISVVKIQERNILSFLQDNELGSDRYLRRSGRLVFKHRLDLDTDPSTDLSKPNVFTADLSGIMRQEPGAIYRARISFKKEYALCNGASQTMHRLEDNIITDQEKAVWDIQEPYYYESSYDWTAYRWEERNDPTKDSFYMDSDRFPSVNMIASDIALIAKYAGGDRMWAAACSITGARPADKTILTVYDYQLRVIGKGHTGTDGLAEIQLEGKPFVIVAEKDNSTGYLKLTGDNANNLSRFDVGGVNMKDGMKAFIYGERGVWRPGDTMHLTMILHDKGIRIPDSHPAVMELYTPQGQFYSKTLCPCATDGFYRFDIPTCEDDPTGFWNAWFKIGGTSFHKTLRVESVKPNRLKVNIDMGTKMLHSGKRTAVSVSSSWLTGIPASELRTKAEMTLSPGRGTFKGFEGYVFHNPLSSFSGSRTELFDMRLDSGGRASAEVEMPAAQDAPGMMTADIVCSVLENGGDSSYGTLQMPFSPFPAYVGIKAPGDSLETGTDNAFRIAVVDRNGKRVRGHRLSYRIYKLEWSWWWENSDSMISSYVNSSSSKVVSSGELVSGNGDVSINLHADHQDWGRYLVYVRDNDGGHSSGKVVTLDWPSSMGRAGKEDPTALKMITFSTDRESYEAGETVTAYIPAADGKALVSIESSSAVIRSQWVDVSKKSETPFRFKVTPEMAPNFYIHISLIQKYGADNDLPIRRYGVKRIDVTDRNSRLEPVITMASSVEPQQPFDIAVSEKTGKAMTYTLAIVDEGLLDLTAFRTPDPWSSMYEREALGVDTWDWYDRISGGCRGTILPVLGIGGDETLIANYKKDNRFNPVVEFLGPFTIQKGRKDTHRITLPMYVGSVRVMVVAGHESAFGSAEKTVTVKSPLMVLPSLPASLGTGEKVVLPVSVFATEDGIREVSVGISAEGPVKIDGASSRTLTFDKAGDKMAYFSLYAEGEGTAVITVSALGNGHKASDAVAIAVRSPYPEASRLERTVIGAGETAVLEWGQDERSSLSLAGFPAMDFDACLRYFSTYPYSCTEQICSKGLALAYGMELFSPDNAEKAREMIPATLSELYSRQNADGGFAYLPGDVASDPWVTSMAGHFMTAASGLGFAVDASVTEKWSRFQRNSVNNYRSAASGNHSDLDQAYRLYTLALAGEADEASMNRLRESGSLSRQASDVLASTYNLVGKTETALNLHTDPQPALRQDSGRTFGSPLRDYALALESATLCGNLHEALSLAEKISGLLSDGYASTQEWAFATVAMSRLASVTGPSSRLRVKVGSREIRSDDAAITEELSGTQVQVTNLSGNPVYASLSVTGRSSSGTPARADGMKVSVRYASPDGTVLDPASISQGTDFTAIVTVTNTSPYEDLSNVAMTMAIPSGWEIVRSGPEPVIDSHNSFDYNDIRDDRSIWYFSLDRGLSKTFKTRLRAAYRGTFVLPAIVCGPMYDARTGAATASGTAEVTR